MERLGELKTCMDHWWRDPFMPSASTKWEYLHTDACGLVFFRDLEQLETYLWFSNWLCLIVNNILQSFVLPILCMGIRIYRRIDWKCMHMILMAFNPNSELTVCLFFFFLKQSLALPFTGGAWTTWPNQFYLGHLKIVYLQFKSSLEEEGHPQNTSTYFGLFFHSTKSTGRQILLDEANHELWIIGFNSSLVLWIYCILFHFQ